MKKKFIMAVLALALVCAGTIQSLNMSMLYVKAAPASAVAGYASLGDGEASITIQGNHEQSLRGKTFKVYQLFYAENSEGNESINYTFHPLYKEALQAVVGAKLTPNKASETVTEYEVIDYIQSLNTNVVEGANAKQALEGNYSDFRTFVEELRTKIVELQCDAPSIFVESLGNENQVTIGGLDYGYYIIDEVSNTTGIHAASSLCMVSTANPEATINIKSDYPSITKKIQEDDHQDVLGNAGWNDIGDYEIGQLVPYKFESNIPNLNGYDTYYYAWHDVMDEALTFLPDSVQIEIQGEESSYTLRETEYTISEEVSGETFCVEVENIKEIIDREFDQMNALGHNIYGQTVVLTCQAILNDNAAEDTGRPGFENDVRLEFSNDPDADGKGETGFTPWDTVVCFTYKLNVLKTNNYDRPLENAKFKLYADEDCANEIFVKKSSSGYLVMNEDTLDAEKKAQAVEMISCEDGTFTIFGLDQGTYYLKETDAPDGYRAILDPIVLQVQPTFTTDRNTYIKGDGATELTLKDLVFSAYVKTFMDGKYAERTVELQTVIEDGAGNLTVVNQVGSKLPITGSSMTLFILVLGVAMIFVASRKSHKKNG